MYEEIKNALIVSGISEWQAAMTAEHIENAGINIVKEILNNLCT
jgi:hypothetical protein